MEIYRVVDARETVGELIEADMSSNQKKLRGIMKLEFFETEIEEEIKFLRIRNSLTEFRSRKKHNRVCSKRNRVKKKFSN
ncbi:hypothetical protein FRX31_004444 [Thalictrum thalictroides]|uniref:Uncharacterized protein n=1 Tax=Thalictrum thalictroides TaxID=46969 RepID=A0A7J6XAJ8_THATH|nr:hypothetical protein FRX31_004444 [Thalictrum thalictroides]